jgi:transposase
LIEQHGCELLYLPSYSPDYNPIEEAFAKIKNLLRKAANFVMRTTKFIGDSSWCVLMPA